ncbi:MAG: glycosyltransferase family 1 protein, partial [Bacteroidales bacterium]
DRPFSEEFVFSSNITPLVAHPPSRHPLLWYLFFEWSIPYMLNKHKADLFFSPDGWLSLRTDLPQLNVIHDLGFEHFPEHLKFSYSLYCRHYFPLFAQKAKRIATVSEFSKQDIANLYHIPTQKIDVVYNGANQVYKPIDEEHKQITRQKYAQNCDYFIFIGAMHQRKNLANLFSAFDIFKKQHPSQCKLLMIGSTKLWNTEIEQAYHTMEHKAEVLFLGRLEPEELACVLSASIALCYPSFFEGFGIPIIEAYHAETAVITANTSAMPEIAGDAALLIDPYSIESIANAMQALASDSTLRKQYIDKGRNQRKKFSWDQSAEKLWHSIETTIESSIV